MMRGVAVLLLTCYVSSTMAIVPMTFLGKDTGELQRCQFKELSNCKTVSEHDVPILSLAAAGEFIYLGLIFGEIRRCPVARTANCTSFHQLNDDARALSVAGKYIYAATNDGITRCGLHKIEPCSKWYDSNAPIYSLAAAGDYIYAGTDNSVLRCPVDNPSDCNEFHNTTSAVNALYATWDTLYEGLEEGTVQSCNLSETTNCEIFNETGSAVKSLNIFKDKVRVVLETGEVAAYNKTNGAFEVISGNDSFVMSMTTVYATSGLQKHYSGENKDCIWQPNCPPYIIYYDVESRDQFAMHVKDNKLYNSRDRPFNSASRWGSHTGGASIFVMDAAGKIFSTATSPLFLIHHSSLMRGQPVAAAGEMSVEDGVIKYATSCSGHYRQKIDYVNQIKSALTRQGYTREFDIRSCGFGKLLIDLDFNKTDLYYTLKYEDYSRKMKEIRKRNL